MYNVHVRFVISSSRRAIKPLGTVYGRHADKLKDSYDPGNEWSQEIEKRRHAFCIQKFRANYI